MNKLFIFLFCCFYAAFGFAHGDDKKVLLITGSHSSTSKNSLLKDQAKKYGVNIVVKNAASLDDELAVNEFLGADLVLFSGVSERDSKASFAKFTPILAGIDGRFIALRWLDADGLRKNVSVAEGERLDAYYSNGGIENMRRFAQYVHETVIEDSDEEVPAPIILPNKGIYHPEYTEKIFSSLEDYLSWHARLSKTPTEGLTSEGKLGKKPVVGLLFQRASLEAAETTLIDETIARFEKRGLEVLPFYFELSPRAKGYDDLLTLDGNVYVDAIANFRMIHWASQRKKEFEHLGVPVVQALSYFGGSQKDWEADSQGISAGMTPFQLVLPESSGVINPIIVAAMDRRSGKYQVIDYQLDHYVRSVSKLVDLKYKSNADKRISVMVWGDQDVGASFLNIPESLRSISSRLSDEGYGISKVKDSYFTDRIDRILSPFYRSYELQSLIDEDLADLMPVAEYLAWFNSLPEEVQNPINEFWGLAEDNFMVTKREGQSYFVIPRIRNGNMLVMRQPPRGSSEEEDKLYFHKATVPMNHYYLAAYYYGREYWGSDAIVHLGTHGSHEYLPGKERGLSLYDQSNLATWDTPIVYPFIVDNVGEAMQTKRRGSAVSIAHMTPPFAAAGIHGDLSDIHEVMHQYKNLDEGGVKEKTKQQVIDKCKELSLCEDLAWSDADIQANFSGFMDALHEYLEDLALQNQPLGLHSFGELPEEALVISTLIQMLGSDFYQQAAALESGNRHTHSHGGHTHSHDNDEHEHSGQGHHHNDEEDGLENSVGYETVKTYIVDGASIGNLDEALQASIKRGREVYAELTGIKELDHLVDSLAGKYIPVKTGGDPIRHPESLATGFNLYGFDPSKVPTKAAYEQGKEIVEGIISDYYTKHGRYPKKLAFSLWSIETMRQYGVLEAQALYAMGVRPVWRDDGRVTGTEIIPASELKRPRVDVVLSATGLYRDAFPNVMQWLAKAIEELAALKEEGNSIWDNAQRTKASLISQGIEESEAEYLSSVRIFSNESGNYGSGLGGSTIASDSWEADSKLADLYLARMGFFYGSDDSRWGQKAPEGVDLYAETLSGTDAALFSRSSNVYGLLSSDDPFQYFGGLALAIRNIDGKSPEMFISNLRDANRPKAESAAKFMSKELRTRAFHPRWVEEMKKEGYSGAVTMASNVSNFFGWQVMDPNIVREDQWQSFFEVYVEDSLDKGLNEWFEQVDPKAQASIIERMLEATRKEYWSPDKATLEKLVTRYQELVNKYDLVADNEKLREFASAQAAGFGLNLSLPQPEAPSLITDAPQGEQVEGQQLEKVEASSSESETRWLLIITGIACLLIFATGMAMQFRGQRSLNKTVNT